MLDVVMSAYIEEVKTVIVASEQLQQPRQQQQTNQLGIHLEVKQNLYKHKTRRKVIKIRNTFIN